MNHPALYHRINFVQRHDARSILKKYAGSIMWREDGEDNLLDVGCGSGDVLVDYIYPVMPKNFQKIIGLDISEAMIRYAKKTFKKYQRVEFQTADIGGDDIPSELFDQFDHVTSFYCLHWVQDLK